MDPATNQFHTEFHNHELPYVNLPRWCHASVVVPTKDPGLIYFIGGWDSECQYNDVFLYSLNENKIIELECSGKPPSNRAGLSAVAWNKKIILFGGSTCKNGDYVFYNDLHVFDTDTNRWDIVPSNGTPPSPRAQQGAIIVNSKLYIVGGFDGKNCLVDVHIFDLNSHTWTSPMVLGIPSSTSNLQQPKFRVYPANVELFHIATTNYILSCGLNSGVYLYDTELSVWQKVEDVPVLASPCGCLLNDREIIIAGGLKEEEYNDKIYKITLIPK